ncbi:hypothetical protein [Cytobacillus sp. IB215665]|uniref:hypothetical protein n=1 Tax=Cytobacillus sp. IB215665 TaxID=3097357 RepID=UPI002A115F4E|nr:hypothetical protein [Cytobacillus sp. IB215665]MDX8367842.1 hypothetical protein [Cytobacillus sp. IB215665]
MKNDQIIKRTMTKIINFLLGIDQEINLKINDWLKHDDIAFQQTVNLFNKLADNGWSDHHDSFTDYECERTDEISAELYKRAMSYFKGVAA